MWITSNKLRHNPHMHQPPILEDFVASVIGSLDALGSNWTISAQRNGRYCAAFTGELPHHNVDK
jgi:hypothetical protein